jgi:GntR family transcriptional regulator/MocR family aminotransferase
MYVTPAHQYPTGATMTSSRRESWLHWAERCGGYLIEDDYDSDFYYDSAPMPALKSADASGSVIYLGTFSKSLAAGMRMGYLIVPSQLRSAAVAIKGLMTNGSPWLLQAALAEFLHGGEFAHHLRRLRKIYASRRDTLCSSLSDHFGPCGLLGTQAGMHVLWTTPDSMPAASQVEQAAAAVGVGAYALESCNAWLHGDPVRARWRRGVLLGYAALSSDEIGVSIARLAAVSSSSASAVNR